MNNDEEAKPSPYLGMMLEPSENDKEFTRKIHDICLEHGYDNFFIAFSPQVMPGAKAKMYKGFSNTLNAELVIYLEAISGAMRQTWNKITKKDL